MRRRPPVRLAAVAALLVLVVTTACSEAAEDPLSTAPSSEGTGATYVAMGDSFAAGGGAPPYRKESANCARSDKGWPQLIDEGPVDLVACGGATIGDLLEGTSDGRRASQLPKEPRPEVELVTLQIGLNDINLPFFAHACLTGDCLETGAAAIEEVAALAQEAYATNLLDEAYPRLHASFPNARIVHVGYPQLVPADGEPLVGCDTLSDEERRYIRRFVGELNDTIRATAVKAADEDRLPVEFLDTADALAGHELCTADSEFVPIGDPSGGGGHMGAAGYETFAAAVRAGI